MVNQSFAVIHSVNIFDTQPSKESYSLIDDWIQQYNLPYEMNSTGLDLFVSNVNEIGHNTAPWAVAVVHDATCLENFTEGMYYTLTFKEMVQLGILVPINDNSNSNKGVVTIVSEHTFAMLKKLQFDCLMSRGNVEVETPKGNLEFFVEMVSPVEHLIHNPASPLFPSFEEVKQKLGKEIVDRNFKSSEKYLVVAIFAYQTGRNPMYANNDSDLFTQVWRSSTNVPMGSEFFAVPR